MLKLTPKLDDLHQLIMEKTRELEFTLENTIAQARENLLITLCQSLKIEEIEEEVWQKNIALLIKYEEQYFKYQSAYLHEKTMNNLYFKPI